MPGLVKAINVKEGQTVKAGEALCLIEAMKMENVLRAERDATVKTIEAREGDSLAVDDAPHHDVRLRISAALPGSG